MTDAERDLLLREIRKMVREEVRRELAQRRRRAPSPDDLAVLARLLPVIYATSIGHGDRALLWSVKTLLDHARAIDAELLRAPIESEFGSLSHRGTARKLGKLLARCEGAACEGLCLERVSSDRDGVLWCVRRDGNTRETRSADEQRANG